MEIREPGVAPAPVVAARFGRSILELGGNNGIIVTPLALSVWAIPTAIVAFLVHGLRLLLLDRKLAQKTRARAAR